MRCSKAGLNLPVEHFWVVSNFYLLQKASKIYIKYPYYVSFCVFSA